MDAASLILVFLAFAAGGVIKGATGAGAPLLAVPLMAAMRDVQFAVAVFVLPNIVPNLWQYLLYRRAVPSPRFVWWFALAGAVGAGLGTIALAGLHSQVLLVSVGFVLAAYVVFRLTKPNWHLSRAAAARIGPFAGLVAGALQGATGLSAPASLTFLNAIRMDRKEFAATASLFFVALGVVQIPAQIAFGIMTPQRFVYSLLALMPLLLAMPAGAWIGKKLPPHVFDKLVLAILAILAVRLIYGGLS